MSATGCPQLQNLFQPPSTSGSAAPGLNDFAPPPAGQGIQLHVGPFDVPQGSEVQRNYYLKLPSDQAVEITKVEFHYAKGSHHCNVFKSDTEDHPDGSVDTFNAVAYDTYDMWAASQAENQAITFPAGMTLPMKAHQQLLIQTHYVNGVTQAGSQGDVKINIWFAQPGQSKGHVGMLFAINKTLAIPPHTLGYDATKSITFGADKFPNGTNLFAMTGHFHSRGKKFKTFKWNNGIIGDLIYENDTWSEPPFKTFDPPLQIQPGDKFLYDCTFDNNSDATVSFGPRVETQEHANAFMYFYPGPADGHAFYDVNGAP
jgi:hypothetical protein